MWTVQFVFGVNDAEAQCVKLGAGGRVQEAPVVGQLRLPEVDAAGVRVHFDDARCAGNSAARSAPEGAWKRLEASFAPPGADGGWPARPRRPLPP